MSDSEGDEDINDWRFLDAQVLKRGEKDHAPDGTVAQQSVLQMSREAMYSALSKPASTAVKNTVAADWHSDQQRAVVRQARGNFFNTMGWADRHGVYLHPEEVLYLAERGTLVCYHNGVALPVQGVVALCLGLVGPERMQVYSHLKRLGYVVRRAIHDADVDVSRSRSKLCSSNSLVWAICGGVFSRLSWKPFYTSYYSLFKDLQVVSERGPFDPAGTGAFDFFVWKPNSRFKKSQPPPADFRVRVVSADDDMPTLDEIAKTMGLAPVCPSSRNSTVMRMKEGYRSFLYAVVDNSVIGFVRAAETTVEPSINEPKRTR